MGIAGKIDIKPKDYQLLTGLIRRYLPGATIWAFGSRAKFTAQPQSDLDLAAFIEPQQKSSFYDLRDALVESSLPFKVDLLNWNDIPENFKKNIQKEHVVLQDAVTMEKEQAPNNWKKYKLGEIAEINPKVPLKQGSEYSFIEMKDLDSTLKYVKPSAKRELKGGSKFQNSDTLFARITPCLENGKICQAKNLENGIGFGSTEFMIFRGRENLSDTDFIYYLTRTDYVRNNAVQAMTGTSGRQRVEKSALEKLEVVAPDLPTQHSIASILSSLDDKIELNLQMNQTLEAMAQGIFKEWFVNFNFPGFDGELVNGLPNGWRMGKLGEISLNFDSKRIPLSSRERDEKKGIYPYYGAASILDYVEDYIFDGTYLLLGEDGTVITSEGFPVLQYVWGKFWVNNHAHVLQGKIPISTEFLFLFLSKTQITSIVTGAVQPKINQGNLNNIECFIPDINTLDYFQKIIEPIFQKRKSLYDENLTLTQIRDTLLPKLMTGKIEIKA